MSKQPPRAKRKISSYAEEDQKVAAADEGLHPRLWQEHCFPYYQKMQQSIAQMLRNW